MVDHLTVPAGYRHIHLGDIDSTNTDAFRRIESGEPANLWITAERQTVGRGRGERTWTSEPGNLYASLLLQRDVPLATALQLPFVAGVSIHDAIMDESGGRHEQRLTLKWPNDVLLDGKKICGILAESRPLTGAGGLAIAVGFGVNVAHHPGETRNPATNLAAQNVETTPSELFERLAQRMSEWFTIWNDGAGIDRILKAWQGRAAPHATRLTVHTGQEPVSGTYAGLDVDGALLLNVAGETRRILFGDVMYPAPDGAPQDEKQ